MDSAQIIITDKQLPRGKIYREYEWEGDRHKPAIIHYWYYHLIKEFPWKVRVISSDSFFDEYRLVFRTDVTRGKLAYYYYKINRMVASIIKPIYYRTILTLEVWGLAYTLPGTIPSWHDIGKKRK